MVSYKPKNAKDKRSSLLCPMTKTIFLYLPKKNFTSRKTPQLILNSDEEKGFPTCLRKICNVKTH
jgi:hypothetical protein